MMKIYLQMILIFLLTLKVYGQDEIDLNTIITQNKVEINTPDIKNTLTSQVVWSLAKIFIIGDLKTVAENGGNIIDLEGYSTLFWFNKDNVVTGTLELFNTELINKRNKMMDDGIWTFNNENKTLTIEQLSQKAEFKVVVLSDDVLLIEDNEKNRFLFISSRLDKTIYKMALNGTHFYHNTNITDTDVNRRWYTIIECGDFEEGLAWVGVNGKEQHDVFKGDVRYGYINKKGEFEIRPLYEEARNFNCGFAVVKIDGESNYCFINRKGENVFHKKFLAANNFNDGIALVESTPFDYNFIDTSGKFLLKTAYKKINSFSEGLAQVNFQGKWGFIDKNGIEVIYPQFDFANPFVEGLALVGKDIGNQRYQYQYIDKSGRIVIPFKSEDRPFEKYCNFQNGVVKIIRKWHFLNTAVDGENEIFIDRNGKEIKSLRGLDGRFSEGLTFNSSLTEFFDKTGKLVVKPQYRFDKIGEFHNRLAKIKMNDNWGFIDLKGVVTINKNILIPKSEIQTEPVWNEVSDFKEGFAIVKTREKFGYIDTTGNWLIRPELKEAKLFSNGIARVKMPDRLGWNYIDKKGNVLFHKFN